VAGSGRGPSSPRPPISPTWRGIRVHENIQPKDGLDFPTRRIGSSIDFAIQTQRDGGHEGRRYRPSCGPGRLRWRLAGVRAGAVSAVRGNI